MELKRREIWVDYTKLFACFLVVIGHLFQSLTKQNIMAKTHIYSCFNRSIYLFHVALFFICSGYLYQKFSRVDNFKSWRSNILKKALALGIPYFTFSTITWFLKNIFSSEVSTELNVGLLKMLFIHPIAPYWYLYALFFIFLITLTFTSKRIMVVITVISFGLKILSFYYSAKIYCVRYILIYSIWFVLGMCLSKIKFTERLNGKGFYTGIILSILFLVLSVFTYIIDFNNSYIKFILGITACFGVILISMGKGNGQPNAITRFSAKYTMPIFLMHTIFAAPLRSLLLKIGITNWIVHAILGLIISFIGPVIAGNIMCRFKFLKFFLYPTNIVKGRKKLCQPKN